MPVRGPRKPLFDLTASLDARTLVELAADLLATRGHSDIRLTDGPGDGCRDIHSLDQRGEKHITQCKYSEKPKPTISSRDAGELPIALTKLGCKQGLLVTNGRASPQVKREYLDDYPGLSLELWTGEEIVGLVLDSAIIRALWFDGQHLSRISRCIAVPLIVRDRSTGRPLLPLGFRNGSEPLATFVLQEEKGASITCRVLGVRRSELRFAPYCPPPTRNMDEGWGPEITCYELVISGHELPITMIDDILELAGRKLCHLMVEKLPSHEHQTSVRFGVPSVTPLSGESAGLRIELDVQPWTIVCSHDHFDSEIDWLAPSHAAGFWWPSRLSAGTADSARWYYEALDCTVDLEVLSVPTGWTRFSIEEQAESTERLWAESVFYIVSPAQLQEAKQFEFTEHALTAPWTGESVLLYWLHPWLGAVLRPALIGPSSAYQDRAGEVDPFAHEELAIRAEFENIQVTIDRLGAERISPERARHIVASQGSDPFLRTDAVWHRSVDIMTRPQEIPSPILPKSRRASFLCCWRLSREAVLGRTTAESLAESSAAHIEAYFDTETWDSTPYFVVVIYFELSTLENSSDALLRKGAELGPVLNEIQRRTVTEFPGATRDTRRYWLMEYSIGFREP